MDEQQKVEFINSFMDSMKELFLSEVPKFPEHWDGFELRWYIARAFTAETKFGTSKVSRKKAFSKDLQVLPLRY